MSEDRSISLGEYIGFLNKFGRQQNEFEAKLTDHDDYIKEVSKRSVAMKDSFGNSLLSIGNDDKVSEFDSYSFDNDTLNWTLWLALYNDSWVFRRAIDKPAQDEIKCGITLGGASDKSVVLDILNKHRSDFIQLLQWGALFGGAIAVMQFDRNMKINNFKDPLDYSTLSEEDINTMRMYVVDRWYGVVPSTDTVENMKSLDYGKPEYYDVTFADGQTFRVHHSYILRCEGRTAPKLIKNGMLQGWGYAEGAHIINEITRDEKLKASVQSLVNKALVEVIKMPGMRGVFYGADKDNGAQLDKRLQMVNWTRNFNSLTLLDKEDEYEMTSFNGLNGLSDLLEKNMWLISAALEMQGVLYGDLKQGFSNDSDALERYDQTINGRCESFLRPVYEKFLTMLYEALKIQDPLSFTFNSLLMEKQSKERIADLQAFVMLCSQLQQDGVITPQQYAKAVQTYSTKGSVDFGLTDDVIEKLDDDVATQMEGIDLSGGVNPNANM